MIKVDLTELDRMLNETAVIARELHPVSLAYLEQDVTVYSSLQELVDLLDDTKRVTPHRAVCFHNDPRYALRFPVVDVDHEPFSPDLNRVLLSRYDFIAASMLTHAQIADRIVRKGQDIETLVLFLVDGLSYADCRSWPAVEPCLASPPTVTRVGFPCILGSPPIASRLFSHGLTRLVGFTYWRRKDEPLTERLFRGISETLRLDPMRPNAFEQLIDWLTDHDLGGTYVQTVLSGLDDYAEGHREAVPRSAILKRIREGLDCTLEVLRRKGRPAALFVTSDHGLLWKEDGHEFDCMSQSTTRAARYLKGRTGPGRGRSFEVEGQPYWVLDYPQLTRPWRANEQGVHGGLSFDESIVPFVCWEVNQPC